MECPASPSIHLKPSSSQHQCVPLACFPCLMCSYSSSNWVRACCPLTGILSLCAARSGRQSGMVPSADPGGHAGQLTVEHLLGTCSAAAAKTLLPGKWLWNVCSHPSAPSGCSLAWLANGTRVFSARCRSHRTKRATRGGGAMSVSKALCSPNKPLDGHPKAVVFGRE